jgi:hypothetical protein
VETGLPASLEHLDGGRRRRSSDCAEVGGSVSVYGSDPHGLDADGDGVGCE